MSGRFVTMSEIDETARRSAAAIREWERSLAAKERIAARKPLRKTWKRKALNRAAR